MGIILSIVDIVTGLLFIKRKGKKTVRGDVSVADLCWSGCGYLVAFEI